MDLFGLPVEILPAAGAAIFSTFKAFKFVREGEEGIMLRFGKARRGRDREPKVYKPGFAILIPFADSLVTRHVRIQTIELKQQTITIKNGLSYVIDAVVRFRVVRIYNALFVVDNLDTVMRNVAMSVLREVITPAEDAAAMSDTGSLSHELTKKLLTHGKEWGVEIEEFSIISSVPTPESQQIVNASAGAEVRFNALIKVLGGVAKVLQNPQLAAALIGIPVSVNLAQPGQKTLKAVPAKAASEEKK